MRQVPGAGVGAIAGETGDIAKDVATYCAVQPPSIDRIAPVTEAAASEQR